VQMQLIDFCISVIMETDTRRQMATFSSPIMAGNMKLMVRKQVYDNRWDPSLGFKSVWFSWLQPFSPFLPSPSPAAFAAISPISEGSNVPSVTFKTRTRTEEKVENPFDWKDLTSEELFKGKRVVVFALPGAFTPTCSSTHLPGYENKYDEIKALGIDEVYCLSVNDAFVMRQWGLGQGLEEDKTPGSLGFRKVKLLPDGACLFTRGMGMSCVWDSERGFGERSWRYSMVVNDMKVEKLFMEPNAVQNSGPDPFEVSDADTMLAYLKSKWLLVGLLVIAAGIAFYWAEEAPETGCCSEGPWTSVKTGVSQGTLSFFAGGDLGDTKTRAGMWIRVGFAVFSMVMLASYTANLATMLVIDAQQSAGISGIKDCDPPSDICQKVCVISQQLNLVRAQHPTMDVVIFQNSGDLAQGLVDGECQAAIVPEHDVNARSDYQETMCENGFHL
ncbi:unnamed protein product, partial [Symbiodinium microadriaticum]